MKIFTRVTITAGLIGTAGIIFYKCYKGRQKALYGLKSKLQRTLCYGRQDVQVHIIDSLQDWEKLSPNFIKEVNELEMVGFDVEWYNNGKIALMQLATPNGLCLLIRLNRIKIS